PYVSVRSIWSRVSTEGNRCSCSIGVPSAKCAGTMQRTPSFVSEQGAVKSLSSAMCVSSEFECTWAWRPRGGPGDVLHEGVLDPVLSSPPGRPGTADVSPERRVDREAQPAGALPVVRLQAADLPALELVD